LAHQPSDFSYNKRHRLCDWLKETGGSLKKVVGLPISSYLCIVKFKQVTRNLKTMQDMNDILNHFDPITLEQMSAIRLMNRTDTKFVTTLPKLRELLAMAQDDYFVQEIDGERIAPYYTLYFDTDDCAMYTAHESGHTNRQKLRIRSYVNSGLNFLEVKTKNNHGRTKKKRVLVHEFDPSSSEHNILFQRQNAAFCEYDDFLRSNLQYNPFTLCEKLENRFDRITLVNKGLTERLTIDMNLRFHNITTGNYRFMDDIVIIELKRDGRVPSPILALLKELRIKPQGFSKYCIGSAMTNDQLHCNRIKPRLHSIQRILAA